MATVGGIKAGKAFVEIGVIDATGKMLSKIAGRLNSWGRNIAAVGGRLIMGGALASVPIIAATRNLMGYEEVMARVASKSNGTVGTMDDLREAVRKLAMTSRFSRIEIAKMMEVFASQDYSRKDIEMMTPAALNLARAAGDGSPEDAKNSADLITGALRAYRLEANQSAMVSDKLTAAVNMSKFSLDDLIVAASYAFPAGKEFGVSMEETLATIGVLRDLNITGTTAATAFRNIMVEMSTERSTNKVNKKLQSLTGTVIKFRDEAGNLQNPIQVLFAMGEAMKDLGTAQKQDILRDIFGKRSQIPASMLSRGQNPFARLLEGIQNPARSAEDTAKSMYNLSDAVHILYNWIMDISGELTNVLTPAIKDLKNVTGQMLHPIINWIQNNKKLVLQIALAIPAAIALGVGMVVVGKGMVVAAAGMSVVGAILSTVLPLLTAVAGIFTALPTAFMAAGWLGVGSVLTVPLTYLLLLYSASDNLSRSFQSLKANAKNLWSDMGMATGGIASALELGDLEAAWRIAVLGMKLVWLDFIEMLKGTLIQAKLELDIMAYDVSSLGGMSHAGSINAEGRRRIIAAYEELKRRGQPYDEASYLKYKAIQLDYDIGNARMGGYFPTMFKKQAELAEVKKRQDFIDRIGTGPISNQPGHINKRMDAELRLKQLDKEINEKRRNPFSFDQTKYMELRKGILKELSDLRHEELTDQIKQGPAYTRTRLEQEKLSAEKALDLKKYRKEMDVIFEQMGANIKAFGQGGVKGYEYKGLIDQMPNTLLPQGALRGLERGTFEEMDQAIKSAIGAEDNPLLKVADSQLGVQEQIRDMIQNAQNAEPEEVDH